MKCGVRGVILILALVPATLISSSLIAYFAHARIQDIERDLAARGEAIVAYLAPAAEFGVFSGDRAVLERLAQAALGGADVMRVTILDKERAALVDRPARPEIPATDGVLWFDAPVHRTLIEVDDFGEFRADPETREREGPVIGAVRVALSRAGTSRRQREVFWIGVSALLVSLLVVIGVGLHVGGRIYRPIRRVSKAFDALRQGDLDIHLPERSPWELGVLEHGLNLAAAALNRAHHELQAQVNTATSELRGALQKLESQNAELERAHREALRANEAKSRFLSGVSHEFRTPLHGVIAGADLLMRSPSLDARQIDHATTIHHSARLLLNLVNNILDGSKLDATGELVLGETRFRLPDLMRQVVGVIAPEARAKDVRLDLIVDRSVPPTVRGDPTRLGQVLMNLVGNAVKFTEQGTVTVSARAVAPSPPAPDEKAAIRFEIADTGIGIEMAALDRIFEGFAQAHAAIARDYGGTGLGLSIAKLLVERMGGRIGAESAPRAGSRFWFEVPLCASPEPATAPAVPARRGAARSLRVLVADDSWIGRYVMEAILTVGGHRPHFVSDGLAALAALRGSSRFDLAILDLHMPKLYGHEVVARYRQDHPTEPLPVILLTADKTEEGRAAARTDGVDAYLTKPITVDAVLDAIERLRVGSDSTNAVPLSENGRAHPAEQPDLLDELSQITPSVLPLLAQTFMREAKIRLELIRAAADSGDWGELRENLHLLDGAAVTTGAALAGTGEMIRRAIARGDTATLQAGIRRLSQAVDDVIERLNSYLSRS